MSDSYKVEGLKHKAKELVKSELYAETEVGTPYKKERKRFVIEYRFTEEVWNKTDGWLRRWSKHNEWRTHKKYSSEKDMLNALQQLEIKSKSPTSWEKNCEYRIKPSS